MTFKTKFQRVTFAKRIYLLRERNHLSLHLSQKERGRRLVQTCKQFLVVIDYYSRFPEIAFVSSTTSDAVINKLKDIFARRGVPDEIVGDSGPQFSSEQFHKFSQEYDFKLTTTSPYDPQAHGETESGVHIAKKILRQCDPFLVLMSYRATPHTATGVSPYHPSTYIGIQPKACFTKPQSSYQKG